MNFQSWANRIGHPGRRICLAARMRIFQSATPLMTPEFTAPTANGGLLDRFETNRVGGGRGVEALSDIGISSTGRVQ